MVQSWIEYIPWVYASIQGIIILIVSIVGAKYVRHEFLSQKKRMEQQQELQINIQQPDTDNDQQTVHHPATATLLTTNQAINDTEEKGDEEDAPLTPKDDRKLQLSSKSERYEVCQKLKSSELLQFITLNNISYTDD